MSPLTPERQYVTLDYALKYMLRDKADFGILEGLLTCVLKRPVKIRTLMESETNPEHDKDKINRVDLLCSLEPIATPIMALSGRPRAESTPPLERQPELVYIEFQYNGMINFFHRMVYGSSKLVVEQLGKGMDYEKLSKVISVTIADFMLGEGSDYAYHGTTTFKGLHTADTLQLSLNQKKVFGQLPAGDIFPEYYVFRLKAFVEKIPKDHLDQWLYFMKKGELPENFDAPGLEEAKERLDVFRMTPEERQRYDRYLEEIRDRRSWERSLELDLQIANENILAEKLRADEEKLRAESALQQVLAEKQRANELEQQLQAMKEELLRAKNPS